MTLRRRASALMSFPFLVFSRRRPVFSFQHLAESTLPSLARPIPAADWRWIGRADPPYYLRCAFFDGVITGVMSSRRCRKDSGQGLKSKAVAQRLPEDLSVCVLSAHRSGGVRAAERAPTGGHRRSNSPVEDVVCPALGTVPEVSLGLRPCAEARRTVF